MEADDRIWLLLHLAKEVLGSSVRALVGPGGDILAKHLSISEAGLKEGDMVTAVATRKERKEGRKKGEGEESPEAIVLDIGSFSCRVGLSGEDEPRSVVRSVLGRPKVAGLPSKRGVYVGNSALAAKDHKALSLTYPIGYYGPSTNWDDVVILFQHIFYNELRLPPEDHPVLVTEMPLNPKENRERITAIMFEVFEVPAFYLASRPALSLYGSGRTSGLVVQSGSSMTHVVPVREGYILPHAVMQSHLGGQDVTKCLAHALQQRDLAVDFATLDDAKISFCFVRLDADSERCDVEQAFQSPDGQVIRLSTERYASPEVLFQPNLVGKDCSAIHELAYDAVFRCDVNQRKNLCDFILLAGGNTLFTGLEERSAGSCAPWVLPSNESKSLHLLIASSPPGLEARSFHG
eukprot:CAMPEP_0115073584 /NCGR_PEP_ID=MMETSP0227-20121206/14860_1 /TAXON_ID=89957 /ORGANISM="Polarella glacialis, Strain CCMP 1383" /LENGTH=405 /DNA_ID=CAMNT_0002460445 /DNA_START=60 /DNA_END=1277 /DNA_ORIENTATION=-